MASLHVPGPQVLPTVYSFPAVGTRNIQDSLGRAGHHNKQAFISAKATFGYPSLIGRRVVAARAAPIRRVPKNPSHPVATVALPCFVPSNRLCADSCRRWLFKGEDCGGTASLRHPSPTPQHRNTATPTLSTPRTLVAQLRRTKGPPPIAPMATIRGGEGARSAPNAKVSHVVREKKDLVLCRGRRAYNRTESRIRKHGHVGPVCASSRGS